MRVERDGLEVVVDVDSDGDWSGGVGRPFRAAASGYSYCVWIMCQPKRSSGLSVGLYSALCFFNFSSSHLSIALPFWHTTFDDNTCFSNYSAYLTHTSSVMTS